MGSQKARFIKGWALKRGLKEEGVSPFDNWPNVNSPKNEGEKREGQNKTGKRMMGNMKGRRKRKASTASFHSLFNEKNL